MPCDLRVSARALRSGYTGCRGSHSGKFLAQAEAVVTFDFGCAAEPRVLELVNKTNQFNLNGRRYTEADWRSLTICSLARWSSR